MAKLMMERRLGLHISLQKVLDIDPAKNSQVPSTLPFLNLLLTSNHTVCGYGIEDA
jgi:hypothetical protein